MDNNMGSSLESDPSRRPMRRRSHGRKTSTQDRVINMAEARREIAHALHLHRSSSASSPSPSSSGASRRDPSIFLGNNYSNYGINNKSCFARNSQQYLCHSLTDTLPTPEPVWSTTTTTTALTTPSPMEITEFEWGENQAASYSWWLGFLQTLDSNSNTRPCLKDEAEMISNPRVFRQCEINVSGLEESSHDQLTSISTDEWLTFPNNEDQDDQRQVP